MIQEAATCQAKEAAELALLLWPDNALEALIEEMAQLLVQPDAKVFLAYDGKEAVGFAQCQLRHDYVEGTSTTPVGYLEGLYVKEPFRRQGVARELTQACEAWAKAKGCREFASDCELGNEQSVQMHAKLGFREANRIVCFTKKIEA
ncbi:MAG: aminoglycoside 6'-N-acetyltransferase [Lysinibacillus sp.]